MDEITSSMSAGNEAVHTGQKVIGDLYTRLGQMNSQVNNVTGKVEEIAGILSQQTAAANEVADGTTLKEVADGTAVGVAAGDGQEVGGAHHSTPGILSSSAPPPAMCASISAIASWRASPPSSPPSSSAPLCCQWRRRSP